jgi:Domain of unknown function (DUF5054)
MEESWVRQATWGLDDALLALEDHPLAAVINTSWAELSPQLPDLSSLKYVSAAQLRAYPTFSAGRFTVGFDPDSGALAHLVDETTGTLWGDFNTSALGVLNYATYDQDTYTNFMLSYNYGMHVLRLWGVMQCPTRSPRC